MTNEEILAIYERVREHAKTYKDGYGNGNADAEIPRIAFHGLRTEVHSVLQLEAPAPDPHPEDGDDPDLHWVRQKKHQKGQWVEADALIAEAGITEKGAA